MKKLRESHNLIGDLLSLSGFFVTRHLGLLLCNIAIMKRFLPLFILSSFLFGQDLHFKNVNNETIKISPMILKEI
jgi:hypothetical protein